MTAFEERVSQRKKREKVESVYFICAEQSDISKLSMDREAYDDVP